MQNHYAHILYYRGKKFAAIVFKTCSLKIISRKVLFSIKYWNKKLNKHLLDLKVIQPNSYKRFLNFTVCA